MSIRTAVAMMLVSIGCACGGSSLQHHRLSGRTMGTNYHIELAMGVDRGALSRNQVKVSIELELEAIERAMSSYREDSEVTRFNHHQSDVPFSVSPETAEVFNIARIVGEMTEGALDITVGALVNVWGFGPTVTPAAVPDPETLQQLENSVGHETIEVDLESSTLRKMQPHVVCDLSAVAKGYGVDRIAHLLNGYGIENYMVEVGGEVRTLGLNAQGLPWRIAIERPSDGPAEIETVVPLSGLSIATSGDYRNYHEYEGQRFSHIIDPRTGSPISHRLASVSVIHRECAFADAFATALLVMGPEEGMNLAEKLRLPALFIIRNQDSTYQTRPSKDFTTYLREMDKPGQ